MSPNTIQLYMLIMSVCWFILYLAYRPNEKFMMLVSILSSQLWLGLSVVIFTINSIN